MKRFLFPIVLLLLGIHTVHAQPLVVNSFSPTVAPVGATVSFQCSEFNGYIVDVFFGGVICNQVSEFDGTSFSAVVPPGALSGQIEIQYAGQANGSLFPTTLFTVCTGRNALTFNMPQAKAGTSIQLYGDGFSTSNANNIVFFGDARATVTSSSLYTLTVTVPTGADYSRISALNTTTRITQNSTRNFQTTFPSKYSLSANDFNSPISFANTGCTVVSPCLNTSPESVDIDGDGRPEVVFSDKSKLLIHRNVSAAGKLTTDDFLAPLSLSLSAFNHPFCFGDLNSDGKPDFITSISNGLQIRRNQATSGSITASSFVAAFTLPFPANGSLIATNSEMALGDFNRDGKTDIAVSAVYELGQVNNVSQWQRRIIIFENTSTTTTISTTTFKASVIAEETGSTIAPGGDLQVADMDDDGKLDILVGGLDLTIFRNQSVCGTILAGSFAAPVKLAASFYFNNFAVGDLNGDQKQDVILATPNVEVFQNNNSPGSLAAANFASPISLNTDGIDNYVFRTVVCGDFDGDGKLDLFTIRPSTTEVNGVQMAIFRNTTAINGTLFPSQFVKSTFADPFVAAGVIASDMDKDGKTDLVLTTASDYRIYRNRGNDAYCSPSLSDGCGQLSDPPTTAFIQGVRLVNQATSANQVLSAATGCGGGYSNFSQDPARYAIVQTGQAYNAIFDLTGNAGSYPLGVKIWGDFNQDSDFDDAGELLWAGDQTVASNTLTASFSFPTSISPGTYRIRTKATAYPSSSFGPCDNFSGETEDYTAVISDYCIPSYTQSCLTNNFFINSVQLGSSSLVNAGCNGQRDNYTQDLPNNQFPNRKFTVLAGSANSLSIGLGIAGQVAIWIDYNNDKSFATTELVALSSVSSPAHTFTVTIPSTTATLGLKRMRVRSLNATITNAQACATLAGYGETEDFLVEIRHNPGTITTRRDTICNGGTPAAIAFATNPTGGTSFNYDWYYKPGIQAQPSGLPEENGWIFIPTANVSGQTFPNYAPTAITAARTYACYVSPKILVPGISGSWAAGVRQVDVLAPFNPGTITSGDETFCTSGNPSNITMSVNPSGAGAYTWRWYWRENATGTCPTGSTVPSGWATNSTSPNITGKTISGAGISFDPSSAGALGAGRTFAVLITPVAQGGIPACGAPQWAASCRKTFVQTCPSFNPGSIGKIWSQWCYNNPTGTMSFSIDPSGATSYTFQWYSYNGILVNPTGSTIPAGWTAVTGGNVKNLPAQPGLTSDATFACFVTANTGAKSWADGYFQYQIKPAPNTGTLASGNQTLTAPAAPSVINFSINPAGADGYFFQWYEASGILAAPTGTAIPANWTPIGSATAGVTSSFTPPSGLTASKSYACFVNSTGTGGLGCLVIGWASGVRQITVNPVAFNPGTVAAGNQTVCNGASPAAMTVSGYTSGASLQWFYQTGTPTQPAENDGIGTWQILSGASSTSYTSGTLTATRTFACRVTLSGTSKWASGMRVVTVLPVFNPGTVNTTSQNGCITFNPAPVTLTSNPVGSGAYNWKWYYWSNTTMTCPSGSTVPSGGVSSTTDVRFFGTSVTGAGISFDASSPGTSTGRTWAVLITPVANGSIPACGTAAFASGCQRHIVVACREAVNERELINEAEGDASVQWSQNIPNPFSDETTISCFVSPETKTASLEIYGLDGRKVQEFNLSGTGKQDVLIQSKMLPASGMYLYTLVVDGQKQPMKRMVLVK